MDLTDKKMNVLLIEDNEEHYLIVKELFSQAKNQTVRLWQSSTLRDGIKKIKSLNFDAVFLDLTLSDSGGLESIKAIRGEKIDLPIVILSGNENEEMAIQTLKAGAQDYLIKGQVNHQILTRTLRYAIERQKAEERLFQANQFLDSIIENIPNMIFVKDAKDLRFVRFNKAGEKLLGFGRKDLLGKNDYDFFSKEEADFFTSNDYEVLKKGTVKDIPEETIQTKNLGKRKLHTQKVPICDPNGNPQFLLGISEDITDLDNAQRERDHLFNESHDLYCVADYDTRIQQVNPAWESLLGYSADELHETLFLDFVHPDDYEATAEKTSQLKSVKTYQAIEFVNRVRTKNWGYRWISWHVVPYSEEEHFYFFGRDVTDNKKIEEELKASEERLRTIFNSAGVGIALTTPRGNFIQVNPYFLNYLGYTKEELLKKNFLEVTHPDDREMYKKAVLRTEKNPGQTEVIRKRYKHKDGRILWGQVAVTSVLDEQKIPQYRMGIVQDMTKHMEAEFALEESQKQLHQSQKMDSIGRLAGGIAHDFNNLLTTILSFCEFILQSFDEKDPRQDDIKTIISAGERAATLTRQLLAFSRKQVLQPVVLNLNNTICEFEEILKRSLREDINLELKLEPNIGTIRADPGQIEQVMLNLAINARDAMPHGGSLTLKTMNINLRSAEKVDHYLVEAGRYVTLIISDTGKGIEKSNIGNIFEPFFSTKEQGKGTGLGLSTVYGIIKQSDGFIDVSSEVGKGTTFKIYFPRIDQESQKGEQSKPSMRSQAGSETILIVEDEPGVRAVASRVLKGKGFYVIEAGEGHEAIRLCERHNGPIRMLISDVVMPGMNGKELSDKISALRPDIKVLYMSGYPMDVMGDHGILESEVNFIQKPVKPNELLKKVQDVLKN